jgi:hypothetical protein
VALRRVAGLLRTRFSTVADASEIGAGRKPENRARHSLAVTSLRYGGGEEVGRARVQRVWQAGPLGRQHRDMNRS